MKEYFFHFTGRLLLLFAILLYGVFVPGRGDTRLNVPISEEVDKPKVQGTKNIQKMHFARRDIVNKKAQEQKTESSSTVIPTPEEIQKEINNLGHRIFRIRERATARIWKIGKPTLPFLQKALSNSNQEIRTRAKDLWEKMRWGIYSDTPKDLAVQLDKFRNGSTPDKLEVINSLFDQKKDLEIVANLFDQLGQDLQNNPTADKPDEYKELYVQLNKQIRLSALDWLNNGKERELESLLLAGVRMARNDSLNDYAAFAFFDQSLDEKIKYWQKQLRNNDKIDLTTNMILLYLYHLKMDWKNAREITEKLNQTEFKWKIAIASEDWQRMTSGILKPIPSNKQQAIKAFLFQLMNENEKAEKIWKEELKSATSVQPDRKQILSLGQSLILTGHLETGLELIKNHGDEPVTFFDFLCQSYQFVEAFQYMDQQKRLIEKKLQAIDQGVPDPNSDKNSLERNLYQLGVHQIKQLFFLGERDSALQLSNELIKKISYLYYPEVLAELISILCEFGQEIKAIDIIASIQENNSKGDIYVEIELLAVLLKALFQEETSTAELLLTHMNLEKIGKNFKDRLTMLYELLIGNHIEHLDKISRFIEKLAISRKTAAKKIQKESKSRRFESLNTNQIYLILAKLYEKYNKNDQAYQIYEKILLLSPIPESFVNGYIYLEFGDFLIRQKKFADAEKKLAKSVALNGDLISKLTSQALQSYVLEKLGKHQQAKSLMRNVDWSMLGDGTIRSQLLYELSRRHYEFLPPEIIRSSAQILWSSDWNYTNVMIHYGRLNEQNKQFLQAKKAYEKAIYMILENNWEFQNLNSYIKFPANYISLDIQNSIQKNEMDEALNKIEKEILIPSLQTDLCLKILSKIKDKNQDRSFKKALKIAQKPYQDILIHYPKNALSYNTIAWILATTDTDLPKALEHAQKAVRLEPRNAGYLDTLAEVYFHMGNRTEAIELSKKSIHLNPKRNYYKMQLNRFKTQSPSTHVPQDDEDN